MFTRLGLFIATNLAILFVLNITMRLFGFNSFMDAQGVNLDLNALLIYSAVIGFSGSIISLLISKWTAKRISGAQVIEQPSNATEQWLLNTVAQQAKMAGIGMPEVAIFDSADINAFATGANRNNALVAVSTGLLQHMNEDEVEAVLAHEISHVANGDMITLSLIQGVVNTFVVFLSRVIGQFVDRAIFKNERGHGIAFWVTSFAAELVLGILASIIVRWFSRQREFRADAGGAKLAGKHKMVAALQRLQQSADRPHLPDQLAAFGIAGNIGTGLQRLMMTHPPLETRIARLQQS